MLTGLDKFEYFSNELVIGGTLNSLLYAWFTGSTLICTTPREPLFFERFSPTAQLDKLGIENKITNLHSSCGKISTGIQKSEVWKRLFFLLSLVGQAPISSTSQSIRIEDNIVKVVTSHSRLARFRFENLKIFDPSEVGAIQKNRKNPKYMVLDWMHVNTGVKHPYDLLQSGDDFVKNVHFYPVAHRGGCDFKNLVSVSYLRGDELKEYYFSDTYAKFKTEQLMKDSGIKGRKNGFKNGVSYHLNVKITPTKREIFCIDKYDLDYCQLTDEQILEKFTGPPRNRRIQKLLRHLA